MRSSTLAALVFGFATAGICAAQSTDPFEDAVARAVAVQSVASTFEDAIAPVHTLEELSQEHPDRWLAPYWAAYLSTQAAMLAPGAERFEELISGAQRHLATARERNRDPSPTDLADLHALEATVYFFTSRLQRRKGDAEAERAYAARSKEALQQAILAYPDNPRAYVIAGVELIREGIASENAILVLAGRALLDQASIKFAEYPLASRIHPTWSQNWLRSWLPRADGFLRRTGGS